MTAPDLISPDLVTSDWLAAHLNDGHVRVLDGSWWMPADKRDARAEWLAAHIPGARFFDIDRIADTSVPLPHMLPSEAVFADALVTLGIGADDHVVVYDAAGIFAAPRVWWTFRAFGFDNVSVLDGGLPKWKRENRPIDSGDSASAAAPTKRFAPRLDHRWVRSLDEMRANVDSRRELVLDARSAGRFAGTEPEPRAGLRSGHIPGSRSVPFGTLIESGTMKPVDELRRVFASAGVDATTPAVATCGSGLTAAIIAFALHRIGHPSVAVYDGSWSEWGARDDVPISTTD
ncbi:MAG TPA: 3-mercaptopyruvate sulfurtransferase [Alphaproteobacteria bacterium]|jgi:thiosulfate/3-mercaptopyruvate sulfurtransferase|nr:3-mercaptopyruvate sulfurtransferase [Alphaproteobacteria bacterium]